MCPRRDNHRQRRRRRCPGCIARAALPRFLGVDAPIEQLIELQAVELVLSEEVRDRPSTPVASPLVVADERVLVEVGAEERLDALEAAALGSNAMTRVRASVLTSL